MVERDLLVVITSSELGAGEPDLGARLMGSFLAMVLEADRLPARMIFLNSGVFLTTEGSPHAEALRRLAAGGTVIQSCGTCLDYYGRGDRLLVGEVGNMRDTADALLSFPRVRTL